jgi:hypothetical protein
LSTLNGWSERTATSRVPKTAKVRPFLGEEKTSEVSEAKQADAITWSIVLRSDHFPKRPVNMKSSRKCSPPNPRYLRGPTDNNRNLPLKEDTPWNR